MNEALLILEIGEEPLAELTPAEKTAILTAFTDTQVRPAAIKVFDLLRKKYKANYRMGRMYENLSDKYSYYEKLYHEYLSNTGAGRNASSTSTETSDPRKFLEN